MAKADISGLFDEWGHGFFEGQMSAGDLMPPRVTISERSLTVVDGAGASEVLETYEFSVMPKPAPPRVTREG